MAAKINFVGNMTRDPKSQDVKGQNVCSFSVAVRTNRKDKDGNYETNYFDCSLWGKRGEYIQNNCAKGSKIWVSGSLALTTYEKDGVPRSSMHVDVDDYELCGAKAAAAVMAEKSEPVAEDMPF